MNALKTLAAAGLIASSLAIAPVGAQAQTAAAPAASSGFDGYRVLAVTAGVIAGAAVAAVVTDGLIIPVYAYATGAAGMGGGMGGGMAAGAGAAEGGGLGMAAMGNNMGQAGAMFVRGSMRLLGAIGGGFYADSWYTGQ
ncbi:hypothetical protein GCM10017083_40200 [Thalassobaculum fulvum]|uniref:Uncharacterized protein n=1 Tax=Thalassobaculum fulvum TaxID=1633335 RepID=A0A918XWB6_9PROT|nr:hypothetical protein [Thalassobaculum fulvum]GHD57993.1 hypothetical protein GCM10017083_40200 [Thalassobaculum fulvum]